MNVDGRFDIDVPPGFELTMEHETDENDLSGSRYTRRYLLADADQEDYTFGKIVLVPQFNVTSSSTPWVADAPFMVDDELVSIPGRDYQIRHNPAALGSPWVGFTWPLPDGGSLHVSGLLTVDESILIAVGESARAIG